MFGRQADEVPKMLLKKIRDALNARGANTIRALGKTFKALDSFDNNRKVDRNEFVVGLKENGVTITKQEAEILYVYLDRNKDGTIDYDEFLIAIRGELNPVRKAMADRCFKKFDRSGNGTIQADDIKDVFNVKMHPKFKTGEMTAEQIQNEFLVNFGDVDRNGILTYDEWIDYYSAVSASIDNDEHFCMLMKIAWKLDEYAPPVKKAERFEL